MIKDALALIGAYAVVRLVVRIVNFIRSDRTGNSGRYRHWEEED